RRARRDGTLLGRHHRGAGIRAICEARLGHRAYHDDAAGWRPAGGGSRRVGLLLGGFLGGFATPYIGWRGMFAVGLLPAALTLYIRAWVPESPHWLMRMGRFEEARRSLAWALQVDPNTITLPDTAPAIEHTRWVEVFRYPRSIVVGCLTGLTQTGGVALTLWMVTLFVMVLHITPAEASGIAIWVSVAAIAGRFLCSWMSDAMGRRASGALTCVLAAVFMAAAGYLH